MTAWQVGTQYEEETKQFSYLQLIMVAGLEQSIVSSNVDDQAPDKGIMCVLSSCCSACFCKFIHYIHLIIMIDDAHTHHLSLVCSVNSFPCIARNQQFFVHHKQMLSSMVSVLT